MGSAVIRGRRDNLTAAIEARDLSKSHGRQTLAAAVLVGLFVVRAVIPSSPFGRERERA
jgi:hypothetical protein